MWYPQHSPGSRPVLMEDRPAGTEKLYAYRHWSCMSGTGFKWGRLGGTIAENPPRWVGLNMSLADDGLLSHVCRLERNEI
jgi:hypothetical protein